MLVYFEEAKTNRSIAVNPDYVVVVFTADEDGENLTIINTTTGNIPVRMSQLEVVAQLNGVM